MSELMNSAGGTDRTRIGGLVGRRGFRVAALLLLLILSSGGCLPSQEPADLVLTNGKILTLDPNSPQVEALAIRNGRILEMGSWDRIEAMVSDRTRILDLEGKLATPGWTESHAHFFSLGESHLTLDLSDCNSWQEVVTRVEQEALQRPPGSWIRGRGWHQEKWESPPEPSIEGLPTHDALTRAVPDHPVLLTHASGHALFANGRAMEIAGVTAETEAPPGGEIVRDGEGRPTGLFRETAQSLLSDARKRSSQRRSRQEMSAHRQEIIRLAAESSISSGITSFHDAGASFEEIEDLKRAEAAGRLPLRLNVMIGEGNAELFRRGLDFRTRAEEQTRVRVRAIKRYVDGALGSHGAWLQEPYQDMPSSRGLNTMPLEELKETARFAFDNGFQLCVHAIGDRANHEVLDLYEPFCREKKNLRWRIEHAQHLLPDDLVRFSRLGVIASIQAIHATSDAPWVLRRLGEERARSGAYVWRSLIDSGALLCNGSDAPVEPIDPIAGFYASVTRKGKEGATFFAEQAMTREEALASFTVNAAYAAFEENSRGTLSPGKLADITVFSGDLMEVPVEEIRRVTVTHTIVEGKVVFESGKLGG